MSDRDRQSSIELSTCWWNFLRVGGFSWTLKEQDFVRLRKIFPHTFQFFLDNGYDSSVTLLRIVLDGEEKARHVITFLYWCGVLYKHGIVAKYCCNF